MTDQREAWKNQLQSDSELLVGLVPRDHQRAAVEILNRLNRTYATWATTEANSTASRLAQEAIDNFLRDTATADDLPE